MSLRKQHQINQNTFQRDFSWEVAFYGVITAENRAITRKLKDTKITSCSFESFQELISELMNSRLELNQQNRHQIKKITREYKIQAANSTS